MTWSAGVRRQETLAQTGQVGISLRSRIVPMEDSGV